MLFYVRSDGESEPEEIPLPPPKALSCEVPSHVKLGTCLADLLPGVETSTPW